MASSMREKSLNREKEIIETYAIASSNSIFYRPCKSDADVSCPKYLLDDDELNVDAIFPASNIALEIVSMPYKNYNRFKEIVNSTKIELVNKEVNLLDSLKQEYGISLVTKINRSLSKAGDKGYYTVLVIDHDCSINLRLRSGLLFTVSTYAAYLKAVLKDIKICNEVILIYKHKWYTFSFVTNAFIKIDSITTS